MLSRPVLSTLLVLTALSIAGAAHAKPPIVAVFGIEDARPAKQKLAREDLANLSTYLSTKVVGTGAFKVVPDGQLLAALRDRKKQSYEACFDTGCQIEVGKEAAAEKTLSTKLFLAGEECVVISTLYDLREAAAEGSADYRGACDSGALLGAMEQIAKKLAEHPTAASEAAPATKDAVGAADAAKSGVCEQIPNVPPGYLTISTTPYSDLYIGAKKIGLTPLSRYRVPAGCVELRAVTADGRERTQRLKIESNKISIYKLNIE
jgi:hypothetical protein